jgi:hypothetical protein
LAAPASAVAAATGVAFDEAIALTRRLSLPHIRRAMAEVVPTARAQRWEPAEVVRALLAEEAAAPQDHFLGFVTIAAALICHRRRHA